MSKTFIGTVIPDAMPDETNVRVAFDFMSMAVECATKGDLPGWAANLRLASEFATDQVYGCQTP